MKRTTYIIRMNRIIIGRTYAWNTARRYIEKTIRRIADEERTTYTLVEESFTKDDASVNHFAGTFTWESEKGNKRVFSILRA